MKKMWALPQGDELTGRQLSRRLGLSRAVSNILVQREIVSPQDALDFIRPSALQLHFPFAFSQMGKAVDRLKLARGGGEKVLVYGDYDVDGVTGSTLLYKVLMDLGFQAVIYIPHRQEEGYGLHQEAVEKAVRAGVKLIVTVDCGITAVTEVVRAKELGLDTIVTDHHEPPLILPPALAIINPKLPGETYPFRELAGVGVAFKLAQALLEALGSDENGIGKERDFLDLVALGTIADVVPLQGENRVLTALGLSQMAVTVHAGLEALLRECGLWGKPLKAGQIAFTAAPRINAAGRIASAKAGLELLLTGDAVRAGDLARSLSKENQERQTIEKGILAEAINMIKGAPLPRVIVLSAPGWHAGVIGIVASRLVERYYRPVFLIAEDGAESKGSARGIAGFHVLEQLTGQKELLAKFGGHRQAAGFSLATANIIRLRTGLNEQAANLPEEVFTEVLDLDGLLELAEVNAGLLAELEWLAPFGAGNPGPVFAARAVPVEHMQSIGKNGEHLKFRFGTGGDWEGVAFRLGERATELAAHDRMDIAFVPEWNVYGDQRRLQLVLRDVQTKADWRSTAGIPGSQEMGSGGADNSGNREALRSVTAGLAEITIARQEVAASGPEGPVRQSGRLHGNIINQANHAPGGMNKDSDSSAQEQGLGEPEEDLQTTTELQKDAGMRTSDLGPRDSLFGRRALVQAYRRLRSKPAECGVFILTPAETAKEKIALQVFEELGIVRWRGGTQTTAWHWLPVQGKLNLEDSLRYTYGSASKNDEIGR